MVDSDTAPSTRQFLALKLASMIAKRTSTRTRKGSAIAAFFQALVKLLLNLGGFGLLTYAGFTWSIRVGSIVAGISCFIFAWLISGSTTTAPTDGKYAPDMRTGR